MMSYYKRPWRNSVPGLLLSIMMVLFLFTGLVSCGLFRSWFLNYKLFGDVPGFLFPTFEAALVSGVFRSLLGAFVAGVTAVSVGFFIGSFLSYGPMSVRRISWYFHIGLGSLPAVFVVLVVKGLFQNISYYFIMVIMGTLFSPDVAEKVKRAIQELQKVDYFESTKALGVSPIRIYFIHIFNYSCKLSLFKSFSHVFRDAIAFDLALSFLRLGDVSRPTLGQVVFKLYSSGSMSFGSSSILPWLLAIFFVIFIVFVAAFYGGQLSAKNEKGVNGAASIENCANNSDSRIVGHQINVNSLGVGFWSRGLMINALKGVSFFVDEGEIVGVVGESGSGKSVLMRSLLGLPGGLPGFVCGDFVYNSGDGRSVVLVPDFKDSWNNASATKEANLENALVNEALVAPNFFEFRKHSISMLFQNARGSLNPYFSLRDQLIKRVGSSGTDLNSSAHIADSWLCKVGLAEQANSFPHAISGGQAQRAALALALVDKPKILIADEPTTGLDSFLRKSAMELLVKMVKADSRTLILVSHDIELIKDTCDRVVVMYKGRIVEISNQFTSMEPRHPYSQELKMPIEVRLEEHVVFNSREGFPQGVGCDYQRQCKLFRTLPKNTQELCCGRLPVLQDLPGGGKCACWAFH